MPKSKPSIVKKNQLIQGNSILKDPILNKGTAFTKEERNKFNLTGLLPPRVFSQKEQVMRVLENVRRKPNDLEKYIFLVGLQNRNETLFYKTLIDNIEELMPIIYTPTVGKACQQYGHIFRRPRGLYLTSDDKGNIHDILGNWPYKKVGVIVVTDGERILGLGDLGANGMGIPVGKLSLYTACAGIPPSQCLPITIDVGTNNETLLKDPLYIGQNKPRLGESDYVDLMDEFIEAVKSLHPKAIIQFEDFKGTHAYNFLNRYRHIARMFNDDIQGTASVVLAGLYSALKITGGKLAEQKILFMGAGAAGIGIGNLLTSALIKSGLTESKARNASWFFDSKGLLVADREHLRGMQLPFAHKYSAIESFPEAIRHLKPTVIVGVSGQAGLFTEEVIRTMADLNKHPIIFPLSNPTSKAECSAKQAYEWTNGKAIFASGSPFDPVTINEKTFHPTQGNNAYIFPGVGLGVLASGARRITDEMFLVSAKALSETVNKSNLKQGMLYPPLSSIRSVSKKISIEVAKHAYKANKTSEQEPSNVGDHIDKMMYLPEYRSYS